jgi:hypothetical protein
MKHTAITMLLLLGASFAGVAHRRYMNHMPIWRAETLAYTLGSAVLVTILLKALGLFPY